MPNLTKPQREKLKQEILEALEGEYFLLSKKSIIAGTIAFLITVLGVSWATTKAVLETASSVIAAKEIDGYKTQAKKDVEEIAGLLTEAKKHPYVTQKELEGTLTGYVAMRAPYKIRHGASNNMILGDSKSSAVSLFDAGKGHTNPNTTFSIEP